MLQSIFQLEQMGTTDVITSIAVALVLGLIISMFI